MWLHTLWVFLTQNGIGQNLTASALLGAPALVHIRKVLKRHHLERIAHAERLHKEQLAALSRVRMAALKASLQKRKDVGPV